MRRRLADPWRRADWQLEVGQQRVGHEVGPADRGDAEIGVRLGPDRVVDLGDDALDPERLGRQLGGHHVAVVTLGQGQEDVRAFGTRPAQGVLVRPVAADGIALERGRQSVEGLGGDVDDRDPMAAGIEVGGDGRADPPAPDDDDVHGVDSSVIGSRMTITAQGAFFRT